MDATFKRPSYVPIWILVVSAVVAINIVVAIVLLVNYVMERRESR